MGVQEAKKVIDQCMDFIEKHHTTLRCIEREREAKEARRALLEKELPGLLAAQALGEVNGNEAKVTAVEDEIESLGRDLKRAPLIIRGLQARQDKNNIDHAGALNILRRAEAEASWQDYKNQLRENYSKELAGKFRQLSRDLNRWDEARLFLEPLTENGDESTKPAR